MWALLCPSVPRASTAQGFGALLLGQLPGMSSPQGGEEALSDPSFGKASGFPPSCSPHTPVPLFPTLPSLSNPSWHSVLPSSLFLGFSASSAVLCSVTAPLSPLPELLQHIPSLPRLLCCIIQPCSPCTDVSGRHRKTKPGWGCCRRWHKKLAQAGSASAWSSQACRGPGNFCLCPGSAAG